MKNAKGHKCVGLCGGCGCGGYGYGFCLFEQRRRKKANIFLDLRDGLLVWVSFWFPYLSYSRDTADSSLFHMISVDGWLFAVC